MPDPLGCDNKYSSVFINVDALGLDNGGGQSDLDGAHVISVPVEYGDDVIVLLPEHAVNEGIVRADALGGVRPGSGRFCRRSSHR